MYHLVTTIVCTVTEVAYDKVVKFPMVGGIVPSTPGVFPSSIRDLMHGKEVDGEAKKFNASSIITITLPACQHNISVSHYN